MGVTTTRNDKNERVAKITKQDRKHLDASLPILEDLGLANESARLAAVWLSGALDALGHDEEKDGYNTVIGQRMKFEEASRNHVYGSTVRESAGRPSEATSRPSGESAKASSS